MLNINQNLPRYEKENIIVNDIIEEENENDKSNYQLIKRTYQPHSKKRNRKFGFLKRTKSHNGRNTIRRRREKGRWRVSNV